MEVAYSARFSSGRPRIAQPWKGKEGDTWPILQLPPLESFLLGIWKRLANLRVRQGGSGSPIPRGPAASQGQATCSCLDPRLGPCPLSLYLTQHRWSPALVQAWTSILFKGTCSWLWDFFLRLLCWLIVPLPPNSHVSTYDFRINIYIYTHIHTNSKIIWLQLSFKIFWTLP